MVLTALLAAFSLGQVARISFQSQLINFYIYEVILAFYIVYLIFKYKLEPIKEAYKKFKFVYWFIMTLFFSTLITSISFSFYENAIAILYLLRPTLYFLFFIYLIPIFKKQKSDYRKSLNALIWITLITSVIQYFFYPNLRNLSYLGWDPHYFRVFGLFFEPAVAAAIFGLATIRLFFAQRNFLNPFLIAFFSILGLLTYARGFYLAVVSAITLFFLKSKNYLKLSLFLVFFVFALFIIPKPFGEGGKLGRTSTIHSRLVDYQQGVDLWRTKPILGVGYNHLPFLKQLVEERETPNHSTSAFQSTFLTILITSGIIGLVIFLLALSQLGAISQKAFYYTIFLGVFSLVDNIFLQPFVFFLYFYLLLEEVSLSRNEQ